MYFTWKKSQYYDKPTLIGYDKPFSIIGYKDREYVYNPEYGVFVQEPEDILVKDKSLIEELFKAIHRDTLPEPLV
jgi:hypothetical protein